MFSSLRRIQWCVAFCAINRLAPWQSVIHHAMDGPPSVDSTSSSRHRSIAGYRPTIVLIAAGCRSVHSMRLSHILGQNPNLCLPTCIGRPRWAWVGGFRQNIAVTFGTEKLEWCGYPKVKKNLKICLVVMTKCMYERDRQTGRQADEHRVTAKAALA